MNDIPSPPKLRRSTHKLCDTCGVAAEDYSEIECSACGNEYIYYDEGEFEGYFDEDEINQDEIEVTVTEKVECPKKEVECPNYSESYYDDCDSDCDCDCDFEDDYEDCDSIS